MVQATEGAGTTAGTGSGADGVSDHILYSPGFSYTCPDTMEAAKLRLQDTIDAYLRVNAGSYIAEWVVVEWANGHRIRVTMTA
jgi:hypothetical protein